MGTLPDCFYSVMEVSAAALCVEAAENQGLWKKNMPTVGDWMRGNWFVFIVIGVVVGLSLIGTALSIVRWCRRIEHRHSRAERNKRVDGMLRLVSASFHGTLSRKASTVRSQRSSVSGHDTDVDDDIIAGGRSDHVSGISRRTSRRIITSDEDDDDKASYDNGFGDRDARKEEAEDQQRPNGRPPYAPAASAGTQRRPSQQQQQQAPQPSAPQAKKKGRRPKKQPA